MQPTTPVTACPHCGGKNGFHTNIVLKAVRSYGWDGDCIDTDSYKLASETNPKCFDCGKSVRAIFKKN